MRILVWLAPLGALSIHSASAAATCPDLVPGAAYPWEVEGHFSGDKWADLSIDIDETGKVTACRVLKSNMDNEERFWTCGALRAQGKYPPAMKDGVPTKVTHQTKMVQLGMRHQQANTAARKRWFREHPQERWDCYPE